MSGSTAGWSFGRRMPGCAVSCSDLEQVARLLGRSVEAGSLLELIGYSNAEKARFVFNARACATDEQALLFEFLDHVREYRWLIVR